jgi:hypothetical protein
MKKLTYTEQIKHPRWQRRRLEMLESSGFECEECGDKESTLHVHHRQYVKGRDIWEYGNSELQVLCETCHQHEHDALDGIKELLASNACSAQDLLAIAAGFCHHPEKEEEPGHIQKKARDFNALAYAAGFITQLTSSLEIAQLDEIAAYASKFHYAMSESRLIYEGCSGVIFGRSDEESR